MAPKRPRENGAGSSALGPDVENGVLRSLTLTNFKAHAHFHVCVIRSRRTRRCTPWRGRVS